MSRWSSEEIKLLTTIYQSSEYTIGEIMEALPSRSEWSIRLKASRLGIKRPEPIQIECCPMCGQPLHATNTQQQITIK